MRGGSAVGTDQQQQRRATPTVRFGRRRSGRRLLGQTALHRESVLMGEHRWRERIHPRRLYS